MQTAAAACNPTGTATYANGSAAKLASATASKGKGPAAQSLGDKENAHSASHLPSLALPAASETRARKELRLTKEQVFVFCSVS